MKKMNESLQIKSINTSFFLICNNPNLAQLVERKAVKFVETFRSLVRFQQFGFFNLFIFLIFYLE